jgi:hypothetical protein
VRPAGCPDGRRSARRSFGPCRPANVSLRPHVPPSLALTARPSPCQASRRSARGCKGHAPQDDAALYYYASMCRSTPYEAAAGVMMPQDRIRLACTREARRPQVWTIAPAAGNGRPARALTRVGTRGLRRGGILAGSWPGSWPGSWLGSWPRSWPGSWPSVLAGVRPVLARVDPELARVRPVLQCWGSLSPHSPGPMQGPGRPTWASARCRCRSDSAQPLHLAAARKLRMRRRCGVAARATYIEENMQTGQ